MKDERYEVLSALIDGEAVDPWLVEQALAEPEGLRRLVDFARLRWELARDDSRPEADQVPPTGAAVARGPWRLPAVFRMAAAAALALALFGAGRLWERRHRSDPEAPPTPARIVTFQPGVDWHVSPEVKP
jgi:negative regulator of sigma E activity